ncbi:MAG: ABC transporter ATP-binding protein [Verrucomicrobiales bacterium]|nr:ABC transporter ATP-binding protein [Verrucomicrobiales bacterium]
MVSFLFELLRWARPYRTRLGLGIAFGVVAGLNEVLLVLAIYFVFAVIFPQTGAQEIQAALERLAVFLPGVARFLGDRVQELSLAPTVPTVVLVVSVIPAVMALRGTVSYLNIYLLEWVAIRVVTDFRGRLLRHLLDLPLSFHSRSSTGELMSRLANDVVTLHGALANSLVALIKDPVALLAFVVYQITQQPRLTLLSLIIFPACLIPVIVYARKIRKSSEAIQNETAAVFEGIHEGLSGVRIVKAYNLEPVVEDQYRRNNARFLSQFMRVTRASELPGPMIEFFGMIGAAALLGVIALGGEQRTSAAGFMAFISAIMLMYARIKSVIRMYNRLLQARAASQRVFRLLELRSDLVEPAHPLPLHAAGQDIRFEHVDFEYGDQPVLRDIDLTVKAGQLVALVGASGSGKTTLTNLLLRFYDPKRGRVCIGDRDLREVATPELRRQIAVVTQETILFNDTIHRNIELGRPGAAPAEIEAAARHAHAHDFIMAQPRGYDTVIGERGGNLSGGQRQRLAIARALLRNAPILVLDEATSALDTESERLVQAALDQLMEGRTTICIAHRLSTVVHADLIVVLAEGRIVETGRHAELLARDGHYRRLYELQFQTPAAERAPANPA